MSNNNNAFGWIIAIGIGCVFIYKCSQPKEILGTYSGTYEDQNITLDFRKNGKVYIFSENTISAEIMRKKYNVEHANQKVDSGTFYVNDNTVTIDHSNKPIQLDIEENQLIMGAYKFTKEFQ